MTRALIAAAVLVAGLAWSQAPAGLVVRSSGEVDWKASGSLPPGAEYHLVYEDPKTHAVQTFVRMPKGYALPPHSHTADETIVVMRGKLTLGLPTGEKTVSPGGYAVIPAGTVFTLKAGGFGGCDFLAAFNGPFDMKTP